MTKNTSLKWVAGHATPTKTYITRVFNFGTWEEWQALKRDVPRREIEAAVKQPLPGQWTRRAKAFAEVLFNTPMPDSALISYDA